MANFGDSFLDMAEAMLGKYKRSSSEVLPVPGKSTEKIERGLKRDYSGDTDGLSTRDNSNTEKDRQTNIWDKMDRRRSIVVVTPPKRRRMTGNYSTVDTVLALNRAMLKVS